MLFESVSTTPMAMMKAAALACAEREARDEDDESGGDNDPLALEPVAEEKADQRADGRGKRDDRRIAEAGRDGDPLFDEQRGHPVREAVEADCLEDVEDAHEDDAAPDAGEPEVQERARVRHRLVGAGRRQRPAVFGGDFGFDALERRVGLLKPPVPREPARAFRQARAAGTRRPARRARRSGPPSASPRARTVRRARADRRAPR